MAAQFVFKGHFISKYSVLSEFIEHLPTSADLSVIRTLPLSLQGPDNASLPGNLSNVLLAGLFRSATEPDNKTFDRQFGTDNRRCRGHYQCQTACQRRVIAFCEGMKRKRKLLRKEQKVECCEASFYWRK